MPRKNRIQCVQHGTRLECQVQKIREITVHHISQGVLFYCIGRSLKKRKRSRRSPASWLHCYTAQALWTDAGRERTEMANDRSRGSGRTVSGCAASYQAPKQAVTPADATRQTHIAWFNYFRRTACKSAFTISTLQTVRRYDIDMQQYHALVSIRFTASGIALRLLISTP